MGQLHDTVKRIEGIIAARKLEPFKTKGQIALKAGFSLSMVSPATPDDVAKLSKLKDAAQAVLGEAV